MSSSNQNVLPLPSVLRTPYLALGLLIAAVIYFDFRDDVYKKVYGSEHDRGQLPLPEGMSWEEAVDRIRRGFANPDVEQVTDTADAVTF